MLSIYSPLDSGRGQIRLLDVPPGRFNDSLTVRLRTASLREGVVPAYEALSYVWGTDASASQVQIDGHTSLRLSITGNLESALRHLRRPERLRTLWVDALCIDQSNISERATQVQLMTEIYTAASQVVIWLGPEEDNGAQYSWSVMSEDFESMSYALWTCDRQKHEVYVAEVSRTIFHVLERPWFERTWVVQEVALPKADPVLTVGHHAFSWNQFSKNSDVLTHHNSDHEKLSGVDISCYRGRHQYAHNIAIIRNAIQNPSRQNNAPFAYQLSRTIRSFATDPRDKVFGILGIARFEAGKLLPDYTRTTREVYAEATAYMLRNRYLSIYLDAPLRPLLPCRSLDSASYSTWPSWLPDFAHTSHKREQSYVADGPLIRMPAENFPMMINISLEARFELLSKCLPPGLPAANVARGNSLLRTVGLQAGIVVKTSGDSLEKLEWSEPPWMSQNAVYHIYHEILAPRGIVPSDYLCTLVPESHREGWRFLSGHQEAELRAFEQFLNASRNDRQAYDALFDPQECKDNGCASCWIDPMRTLAKMISLRAKNRIVFITDTNLIGLSYHEDPMQGIQRGDVLVGLFGVNFPFILRRIIDESETYNMINLASVANHKWGHSFLGNTLPLIDQRLAAGLILEVEFDADVTWKDFEKFGMKEYDIV